MIFTSSNDKLSKYLPEIQINNDKNQPIFQSIKSKVFDLKKTKVKVKRE